MPYALMAIAYVNLNEEGRAAENARKAYELREKVSERERIFIEATYYLIATGELEKAAEVYELWQQTYPRDALAYAGLGFVLSNLGSWEKVLEEARDAVRLEPKTRLTTTISATPIQASIGWTRRRRCTSRPRSANWRTSAARGRYAVGVSEGRCGADGAVGLGRDG